MVFGGGRAAERKVRSLQRAGAQVSVISPSLTKDLGKLVAQGTIHYHQRHYVRGDLQGAVLAYVATEDEQQNQEIAADAQMAGVFLNVADRPSLCSFIVPAIVERGDLLIAISTGGASPALARSIRRKLELEYGDEYALALDILRRLRTHALTAALPAEQRHRAFGSLVESALVEYVRERREAEIDTLLQAGFGDGISLAELGIALT